MITKLQLMYLFILIIALSCEGQKASSQTTQDFRTNLLNYFRNETYSARQVVTEIPTEVWDSFEKTMYNSGTKKKLEDLLTSGRSNIPERAQSLIKEALYTKLTPAERIQTLRSATAEFEIFMLCELLPSPSTWTVENITKNFNFLKKCPTQMFLKIRDKDVMDVLLNSLKRERLAKFQVLSQQIFIKNYGEASSWTEDVFKKVELSQDFLPYICTEIKGDVLKTRQSDVLSLLSQLNTVEREPCKKKLLEIVGLKEASTASEAVSKMNELRQLKDDLMPNDFHPNVLSDSSIAATLDRNIKQKLESGYLRPDGAMRIMYAFGNMTDLTSEAIRAQGICALSLALPSQLHEASVKGLYSIGDINNIVKCINYYKGPGSDEKLHILSERIVNNSDPSRTLTVSQYPTALIKEFGYKEWVRVEPSEAKQILSRPLNGTPQEIGRLIDMISGSDLVNVDPFVREIVPYRLLNEITPNEASRLLTGVQPGSAIALKAAEKFMENQNEVLGPSDVSKVLPILAYMGASQANRFNQATIMEIFKAMGKDAKLTMPAAIVLRKKFDNFTANVSTTFRRNPLSYVSGYDIENIPVSFFCAFTPTEISRLTSAQKKVLLERLGMAEEIEFRCPRDIRMAIVNEGVKAMNSMYEIQPTDVEMLGNALPDAISNRLQNIHKLAKLKIIKKLNEMINIRRVKPCWDSSQRMAIAQMIKDVYGNELSSWESIRPFSCLLYTFKEYDLKMIKDEVLASESCESRNLFPSDLCVQAICNGSLGANEFMWMQMAETNFMNRQRESAAEIVEGLYENKRNREKTQDETGTGTRRRRQTNNKMMNETCDKASYGGANAFSNAELREIEKDTLISCLGKLGRYPMDDGKAEVLARKIVDYGLLRSRDRNIFMKMKYIWTGFSDQTISQSLESWTAPYDIEIVDMMGKLPFSRDQIRALATKLHREMGYDLKTQNSTDLQMINNIICGFATSYLRDINTTAVRDALPGLSTMVNCSNREALESLFKALQASVGSPDKWKASDMMQFGVIFAGIMPEDWKKISIMEMEGVSPLAVREFTSDSIKSMNDTHIECMSPCALAAFTEDQKSNFSSSMRRFLEKSQSYTEKKNSVAILEAQNGILMALFSFLIFIPHWISN